MVAIYANIIDILKQMFSVDYSLFINKLVTTAAPQLVYTNTTMLAPQLQQASW